MLSKTQKKFSFLLRVKNNCRHKSVAPPLTVSGAGTGHDGQRQDARADIPLTVRNRRKDSLDLSFEVIFQKIFYWSQETFFERQNIDHSHFHSVFFAFMQLKLLFMNTC